MNDLLVGFALALVIEGLLWALAPHLGTRLLEMISQTPENTVRMAGAIAIAIGVLIVCSVRG